jgi:hypothetical protein
MLAAANRQGNRAEVVCAVVLNPIFLRSGRAPLQLADAAENT